jgi:hypothetical protein
MLKYIKTLGFILLIGFTSQAAAPTILFEGWFSILLGTKKIGYSVERYEFKDNKFYATTYLKTNAEGSNVTESLKAVSAPDLTPISYQYTSKVGDDIKVIDASFKADTMTLNTDDGKKKSKETKRFKKGTFLSCMLMYLILSQKSGLKVGNDFKYNAIAEEEGTAYTGSVLVKNEEPVKGRASFRLLNEFKGEKYLSWVTAKGETLLTRQPDKNIDVRFADSKDDATENFSVNNKDLEILFGKIPGDAGKETPKGAPKKTPKKTAPTAPPAASAAPAAPPSQEPVEIKGVPPPPPTSSESK